MKYAIIRRSKTSKGYRLVVAYPLTSRRQVSQIIERENFNEDFYFSLLDWSDFINHYASGRPKHKKKVEKRHIINFTQKEIETLNPHNESRPARKSEDSLRNNPNEQRNIIQRHSTTVRSYQRQSVSAMF